MTKERNESIQTNSKTKAKQHPSGELNLYYGGTTVASLLRSLRSDPSMAGVFQKISEKLKEQPDAGGDE